MKSDQSGLKVWKSGDGLTSNLFSFTSGLYVAINNISIITMDEITKFNVKV